MELVRLLLPEDWVSAIELCRSPFGVLPSGGLVFYQKVSSMGNGFTFELESLIFWALVSAVVEQTEVKETRVGVYGDDLIFSVDAYREIERLLSACGFTPNAKKSFSTGPFRESCGKHYFRGRDVTPFYIREDVKTVERLVLTANSIRQWAFRRHIGWSLDSRLQEPYSGILAQIPERVRKIRGPASVTVFLRDRGWSEFDQTSGFLIGDWDECRPLRACKGLEGWVGHSVVPLTRRVSYDDLPFLTKGLYLNQTSRESDVRVSDHASTECKVIKTLHQWWPSRGPWA